ncbi:phosphoinositide phosphatase SAC2-like isoform X2 [Wolffia australiana]
MAESQRDKRGREGERSIIFMGTEAEKLQLQSFRLYKTESNFYMVGRERGREQWRVLKISRLENSELDIYEDNATFSEGECRDLLNRVHEGNKPTGGLEFVTHCFGIVGFIRFLGPYYMLLITKRRQIGTICGHTVYAIGKSELISLPNSSFQLDFPNSINEKSYSYNVMESLQKNFCNGGSTRVANDSMFVWNEFLTRGVRNRLANSRWTVALVHGFFKQVNLSVLGKDLLLTLIARRSRHYAGTRYLKRGVNERGRVANEVETEQIMSEESLGQPPGKISSVVQHRGSIPLYWSQENTWLNPKPSIILHRKEQGYEATRLHFADLIERYGNPIIILNLIKTREKQPRESILGEEYAKVVDYINKTLPKEEQLKFVHWDLHKHLRSRSANVLPYLNRISTYALGLTGIFYSQLKQKQMKDDVSNFVTSDGDRGEAMLQRGVLRTNCIDCLDRTNVAQYAFGLVAFGRQLHNLGLTELANAGLATPLADELLTLYEMMGDTLAMQYGGSGAHNQVFCEKRGQWKASIQSQELLRIIQRYYSNTYADAEKQDAMNLFLGHFQAQQGKPALWELRSDEHYNIGSRDHNLGDENSRTSLKRSFSDSNISRGNELRSSADIISQTKPSSLILPNREFKEAPLMLYDSTPEVSPCEPSLPCSRVLGDSEDSSLNEHGNSSCNSYNSHHFDWLPPTKNFSEGIIDRTYLANPSTRNTSTDVIINATPELVPKLEENALSIEDRGLIEMEELSDSFIRWVTNGGLLHH